MLNKIYKINFLLLFVRLTTRQSQPWLWTKEIFYLTMHSTHFIYGYMVSDIWLRTILIAREETRWSHIEFSFRLTARVLLYASSHRQDNTYHSLCYAVVEHWLEREVAQWVHHEGSIRRPIAPWASTGWNVTMNDTVLCRSLLVPYIFFWRIVVVVQLFPSAAVGLYSLGWLVRSSVLLLHRST